MIKIDVVGLDTGEYRDLVRNLHQALHELKIEAVINDVNDVNEISDRFGMVVTPALFVNGKLACQGHILDVAQIKKCLSEVR